MFVRGRITEELLSIPIYQVDAFTDTPFKGNPAAVCLLPEARDEGWMQSVAAEMNLAETAFLVRQEDGYNLRWFTPKMEVALCGHATLASAHILWQTGELPLAETARFHTLSGLLTAARSGDRIVLDFPATPPTASEPPAGLLEGLGATPVYVGRSAFDYLVEVADETAVRELKPNLHVLMDVDARGIIVTGRAYDPRYDFVSRFFAPRAGVPEDPVTGSAHCVLGPYWQQKLGKSSFVAYQASPRGGVMHVEVKGDRVLLGGYAVTVLRGELL
jgi:PhzF family phenazine biosynthesis protein